MGRKTLPSLSAFLEKEMKEFRDKKIIKALLSQIERKMGSLEPPIKIMEVCGTHTMAIHRYGLKRQLSDIGIDMLSGPGCPVCITPNCYHEAAMELVTQKSPLVLTTFGDMTRVPTQKGSLQTVVPARNSQVKIVYSPQESLELARQNPDQEVVFFGVGFETTIPSIALVVEQASELELKNFSVLSALWLIPPPLKIIAESEKRSIQGFLYPGHVSAIIGEEPYRFIPRQYSISGAIAGFEPADILLAISSIISQIIENKPTVANTYSRVVSPGGNARALAIMKKMLDVKDVQWRGLGKIPRSGLKLKKKYSPYDAEAKFQLSLAEESKDLRGCRCGDVLKGKISPLDCRLFGNTCRPDAPYGPCMVSYEGACLVFYKYNR
jgi:hydrogenase expression/formation protein HypD